MSTRTQYPNITKAALEISYDNGGINRERSEADLVRDLGKFLAPMDEDMLANIDGWLGNLSKEDLNTVCAGERTEQRDLLAAAPPFTGSLLNDIFDEVV